MDLGAAYQTGASNQSLTFRACLNPSSLADSVFRYEYQQLRCEPLSQNMSAGYLRIVTFGRPAVKDSIWPRSQFVNDPCEQVEVEKESVHRMDLGGSPLASWCGATAKCGASDFFLFFWFPRMSALRSLFSVCSFGWMVRKPKQKKRSFICCVMVGDSGLVACLARWQCRLDSNQYTL